MNKVVECEAPDLIFPKTRFFVISNVSKFTIGVYEGDNLVPIARAVFYANVPSAHESMQYYFGEQNLLHIHPSHAAVSQDLKRKITVVFL